MFNNSSPYTAKTTTGRGGGGGGDTSFPPQSPFASGGGQQQQGQHQFGSTNPFENHQQTQRARTTPTTTPFGNETSRNNGAPTPFGGRAVGGQSSLFTSSPAPNANNTPFVGNKDDVSPPPVGNVFQRNPSGVNLGYYEPTARAFANVHAPGRCASASTDSAR